MALLLPRSEAAHESDEGEARRLLFRRSELLGRPSLPSPWLSAHDAFGRTYGLQQILWLCFLGLFFFFLFTFGLGLLLAQASLIILPGSTGEAGAAVRASASLDAKNCLFHALARTKGELRWEGHSASDRRGRPRVRNAVKQLAHY
eukprot:COSAG05_NODE_123_length_17568_cov_235.438148_10_plen_146_part_00